MKLQVLSCKPETSVGLVVLQQQVRKSKEVDAVFVLAALYEGWNFNSGNYLFTTDTK